MVALQQQLSHADATLAELAAENATLLSRAAASDAQLAERDEQVASLHGHLQSLSLQLQARMGRARAA